MNYGLWIVDRVWYMVYGLWYFVCRVSLIVYLLSNIDTRLTINHKPYTINHKPNTIHDTRKHVYCVFTTFNSVRLFCARPASVLFGLTGCVSPYPLKDRRRGSTLFDFK